MTILYRIIKYSIYSTRVIKFSCGYYHKTYIFKTYLKITVYSWIRGVVFRFLGSYSGIFVMNQQLNLAEVIIDKRKKIKSMEIKNIVIY